jgi:hypothetical protein
LPCLATLTIAMAVLGLGNVRPRVRQIVNRPAIVACIASSMVLTFEAMSSGLFVLQRLVANGWNLQEHGHHLRFVWSEAIIPTVQAGEVALVISVCWTLLLLSRRWRVKSGWIDRAGLVVASLWLVFGILDSVEPWKFFPKY